MWEYMKTITHTKSNNKRDWQENDKEQWMNKNRGEDRLKKMS